MIEDFVAQAKADKDFFTNLKHSPDEVVANYSGVNERVMSAIETMSPEQAKKDLLDAPSNDHCFKTSCGNSSFITD